MVFANLRDLPSQHLLAGQFEQWAALGLPCKHCGLSGLRGPRPSIWTWDYPPCIYHLSTCHYTSMWGVLPTVFRYWKQPKIEANNALETRLIHSINHIQRDAATPSPVGNNNRQSRGGGSSQKVERPN